MTFAHVVAPKKAILSDLKSSKATKARRGGSEKSHFMKLLGRWGRNTPSVVFFALRAPELNSFQRLKILVWRSQKFCFRMRRNFLDTSLIWRDVRRASRWRRRIRRYKGSWDFPDARRFSPSCQPSMSLLVLTDWFVNCRDLTIEWTFYRFQCVLYTDISLKRLDWFIRYH